MREFSELSADEQFHVLSNGGRYYATVGELKAALADIDDDTQIAMRGRTGGEWDRGVVLSDRDLITYGEGSTSMTLDAAEGKRIFKGWRGKKKLVKVLGFDRLGL